jgi:lipoate-protein ligase A
MYCRLLIDPPASGAWNMAVDESLLESAATNDTLTLRFYRWLEPTLSLGYFQPYNDRRQHSASRNCPVVRRQTGGGAILHDREITYSFVAPPGHRLALKHIALYKTIHAALIDVLAEYGIPASLCRVQGRESGQDGDCPDFRVNENGTVPFSTKSVAARRDAEFLCFLRRSPGDVLLSDVKIAGSAQRRFKGAVLQHGSLLLARSQAAPELPGIAEMAATSPSFDQLTQAWTTNLARAIPLEMQPGVLSDKEQLRAAELAQEKYKSNGWNQKR